MQPIILETGDWSLRLRSNKQMKSRKLPSQCATPGKIIQACLYTDFYGIEDCYVCEGVIAWGAVVVGLAG